MASETLKLWDVNGSLGGPIVRDKLWFYWTGRHQGTRQLVAGLWANRNAGDNTKWTSDPDLDRQAKDDGTWKNSSIRFTYQATPRNKIGIWWDEQVNCQSCLNSGASGGRQRPLQPDAVDDVRGPCGGQRLHQRLHAGVRA